MKITLHRCFLVALAACSATWLGFVVEGARIDAADRKFYAAEMEPYLRAAQEQARAAERWMQDFRKGVRPKSSNLPRLSSAAYDEWVVRQRRRGELRMRQLHAGSAAVITAYAWLIAALVQRQLRERRRAATDRPAEPGAGARVESFVRERGRLMARGPGGPSELSVEADGMRRVLVFRQATFITKFVGNRQSDVTEVGFDELISAQILFGKGANILRLRTAKGEVLLRTDMENYRALAEIIFDAVELNKSSPETYRALLDREPKVRVPWWGWLPIVVMVALVIWMAARVIR